MVGRSTYVGPCCPCSHLGKFMLVIHIHCWIISCQVGKILRSMSLLQGSFCVLNFRKALAMYTQPFSATLIQEKKPNRPSLNWCPFRLKWALKCLPDFGGWGNMGNSKWKLNKPLWPSDWLCSNPSEGHQSLVALDGHFTCMLVQPQACFDGCTFDVQKHLDVEQSMARNNNRIKQEFHEASPNGIFNVLAVSCYPPINIDANQSPPPPPLPAPFPWLQPPEVSEAFEKWHRPVRHWRVTKPIVIEHQWGSHWL